METRGRSRSFLGPRTTVPKRTRLWSEPDRLRPKKNNSIQVTYFKDSNDFIAKTKPEEFPPDDRRKPLPASTSFLRRFLSIFRRTESGLASSEAKKTARRSRFFSSPLRISSSFGSDDSVFARSIDYKRRGWVSQRAKKLYSDHRIRVERVRKTSLKSFQCETQDPKKPPPARVVDREPTKSNRYQKGESFISGNFTVFPRRHQQQDRLQHQIISNKNYFQATQRSIFTTEPVQF